jgi:tetratricopeptide (TPR) repeat protein
MIKKMLIGLVMVFFIVQGMSLVAADKTEKPTLKEVAKLYDSAEKAMKAKKYDEAVVSFQKAIELEPNYIPSYLGLALVQRDQKKYAESVENLEKMLKIRPDAPMALQAYREILYAAGNEEYQKQDFQKSNGFFLKFLGITGIETSAKKPAENATYLVGLNSYFLKEYEKSIEYFTKFMAFPGVETAAAPLYQISNYMIGLCYTQLNQVEKANPFLQKFIDVNKDPANQQVPLAHYLLGSNNYAALNAEVDKVNKDMLEAVNKEAEALNADTKMKPKDKEAAIAKHKEKVDRMKADVKKKQVELASFRKDVVPYLQKAIELRPDIEDAYVKLGNYYYLAGDLENALKTYKTIKEKFPNSPDITAYNAFIQKVEKEIADKK